MSQSEMNIEQELADALRQAEIDRQIEWEMKAINDGIERYWKTVEGSLADSKPGRIMQHEMLRGLIPRIEQMQERSLEVIAGKTKTERGERVIAPYISLIKADRLALITVRAIVTEPLVTQGVGRSMVSLALKIGNAVMEQAEYEKWRAKSRENAKEGGYRDFARVLVMRIGGETRVDRQRWSRWKQKIDEIERFEWSRDIKIHIGSALLKAAVETCGGWIKVHLAHVRGRTEQWVVLSEAAQAAIHDIHTQMEAKRPYYRPMLVKPRRWQRVESV